MSIAITKFDGQSPRIAPRRLPQSQAQIALNCKLWSTLEPFRVPLTKNTPTKTGALISIYRFNATSANDTQYWFSWTTDVNVVRGAVPGDTSERTYWTGDGVPKFTDSSVALTGGTNYPMVSYTLGIPAPAAAPTVTITGTLDTTVLAEACYWLYTYVGANGEESAPSLPSAMQTWTPSTQTANLSALLGAPTGAYNVVAIRFYRTNSDSTGATAFQFVAQQAIGISTYADTVQNTALAEVLPTLGWIMPPTDLAGLISLPNGGMAGFHTNELCFCVPWTFYAWPVAYRLSVDYPIVGIGQYAGSVIVCTTGQPYLVTGSDPSSMNMVKLQINQACVSKRSIVSTGHGVIYASPDGLVMASAMVLDGAQIITGNYFTRDEWQAINPSSIMGFLHDERYYCFYNNGTAGGFIFDPAAAEDGLVYINVAPTAGYVDPVTDGLYLLIGGNIQMWDAGTTYMTFTWKSKIFMEPMEVNLGFGMVLAASYPVTMNVWADGVLQLTQTVADANAFRLPSGFLARAWEFQIQSSGEVYAAYLASDISELDSQ